MNGTNELPHLNCGTVFHLIIHILAIFLNYVLRDGN